MSVQARICSSIRHRNRTNAQRLLLESLRRCVHRGARARSSGALHRKDLLRPSWVRFMHSRSSPLHFQAGTHRQCGLAKQHGRCLRILRLLLAAQRSPRSFVALATQALRSQLRGTVRKPHTSRAIGIRSPMATPNPSHLKSTRARLRAQWACSSAAMADIAVNRVAGSGLGAEPSTGSRRRYGAQRASRGLP
jgi:hypothetical protein